MKNVLKIMKFAGKTYLVFTVGSWALIGIGEFLYLCMEEFPNGNVDLTAIRMTNRAIDGWSEYLGELFGLIKEN